MWYQTVSAVAAPVAAAIAFLAGQRKAAAEVGKVDAESGKVGAESESVTVATALSLLPPMREQIMELRKEMGELRARVVVLEMHNNELNHAVSILSEQLVDLGHVPGWPPSTD